MTDNLYGVSKEDFSFRPSYVYKIILKNTEEYYIGSRKSSTFLAEDDLWVKYFTSSKIIHSLLDCYEPYSDLWEYEILEQFMTYEEAVLYEDKLLRNIDSESKHKYLNINFSAGGSIIRSKQHVKYLNNTTNKIELFPIDTPIPAGYSKNNQMPPSRKGFRLWINPETFETGVSKIEDFPVGAILKEDYLEQKRLARRLEKKEYQKSRTKHQITDGRHNKWVYTDLKVPDGWYLGKTKYCGMLGRKHSEETKLLMSKNMKGSKNNFTVWNKGLTKETSEKVKQIADKLSKKVNHV